MLNFRVLIFFLLTIHSHINSSGKRERLHSHTDSFQSPPTPTLLLPPMQLPDLLTSTKLTSPEFRACPSSTSMPRSVKTKFNLRPLFSPDPKDFALQEAESSATEKNIACPEIAAAKGLLLPPLLRSVTPLRERTETPTRLVLPDYEIETHAATKVDDPSSITIFKIMLNLATQMVYTDHTHIMRISRMTIDKSTAPGNPYASDIRHKSMICLNQTFLDKIIESPGFINMCDKHKDLNLKDNYHGCIMILDTNPKP